MMSDLKDHLDLLQNPAELEKLISDPKRASEFVYCDQISHDTGQSFLRSMVKEISDAHTFTITPPSLFDIVSLRRASSREDAPEDTYVVIVAYSSQETPEDDLFVERVPLGVYVDGKWRLPAWRGE